MPISPIISPTKIHRPASYLLAVEWSDGFSSTITLRSFRDGCPCAACQGENIMGTVYSMGLQVMKPGMYELQSLTSVGNYAVTAAWNDGHNTGIYSWDILRALTERQALSQAQLDEYARKAAAQGSEH
jgi:DUF971 family protein